MKKILIIDDDKAFLFTMEAIFKEKVEEMVAYPNNLLVIHFKDKTVKEATWVTPSRKESWTPDMKEQARLREERRQLCLQSQE